MTLFIPKNYPYPHVWLDEPDREEFRHEGFDCLLNRNPMGAWCGYVAVPEGHPIHGKHYDEVDVEVHGGLTYAHKCQGTICHAVAEGEDDDRLWWFGFDCAHAWDLVPAADKASDPETRALYSQGGILGQDWSNLTIMDVGFVPPVTYRDINYVRAEAKSLAEQLRALA